MGSLAAGRPGRSCAGILRSVAAVVAIAILALPIPAFAGPPTFTGDATVDFDPADDGVIVIADPGGQDVAIPSPPFTPPTGYDIEDIRLYYDRDTDILYVALNTYTIAGDSDNDGDPNGTSPELDEEGGTDWADFRNTESFGLVLDTDNDGDGDAVAGVNCFFDITTFGTYRFQGLLEIPFCSFGPPLVAQSGTTTNPSVLGPDLEFTIPNFSGLPGLPYDPRELPITIGVLGFQGSLDDWEIAEDHVPAQGVMQPVLFPLPALIAGRVFHDLNADGIKDPEEPGIAGIGVDLEVDFSGGGSDSQSFVSVESGQHGFFVDVPGLETATCTLSLKSSTLGAWVPTSPATRVVEGLEPTETVSAQHFGLIPGPAKIRGKAFVDENGNGNRDSGEPNLADVPVSIDVTIEGQGTIAHDTITNGNGKYEVAIDLDPGQTADVVISIDAGDVPGMSPTTPLTLTVSDVEPSEQFYGRNFGFEELEYSIRIEGRVFADLDGDALSVGSVDGMGGIPVTAVAVVAGSSPREYGATSAGDGSYAIEIPVDFEDVADITVSIPVESLPGARFTTAMESFLEEVEADSTVTDVSFGFQPETIPITGDWDGDGIDTIALYETSTSIFYFRNANGTGPADFAFEFGRAGDYPIAGDWDGDGKDSIGTYTAQGKRFRLRNELSEGSPDHNFQFGPRRLQVIAGDWDGDGIDTVGAHDPETREWFLRNEHAGGDADHTFKWGGSGRRAIAGDWNKNGIDTVGHHRTETRNFYLAADHAPGAPFKDFKYGLKHTVVVIGDWNGNRKDTVGIYRPEEHAFELRDCQCDGAPQYDFEFSTNEWIPLYGDWNGDGEVTVGAYDPATARFLIRNENSSGLEDVLFTFDAPNRVPLVGDWNSDGKDTIGTYEPADRRFRLRNLLSAGEPDENFRYGAANSIPVTGDWNGDGMDTVGLYVQSTSKFFLRDLHAGGAADVTFKFDAGEREPLAGDWDGNGVDTVGTFDPVTHTFRLTDTNAAGPPVAEFVFGDPGCSPVAGDWDGDGYTTVGAYRRQYAKHELRNTNDSGGADVLFSFPIPFW